MNPDPPDVRRMVDCLTRRERGRLMAGLVRRLGARRLELAEDVVQDALLKALSVWPYEGIPDNPAAWLTRVSHNRAVDQLRRHGREESIDTVQHQPTVHPEVSQEQELDAELHLVFLSCHPRLGCLDQIALTLRIVGGFTSREIAGILLTTEDAINQRQSRSRRKLARLEGDLATHETTFQDSERISAALKTIYLMFCLGYAPRTGDQLIRRDAAGEALRLSTHLARFCGKQDSSAFALAALLSFQSSRQDARHNDQGEPILFRDQDRSRWRRDLIDDGLKYLQRAQRADELTRYHLEAAIAACYAVARDWDAIDWPLILTCYGQLESITHSPVVTVNRCIALAFAGDPAAALDVIDGLRNEQFLSQYAPCHIARAEILRLLGRCAEASVSCRKAIDCGVSLPVMHFLEQYL